MTDASDDVGGDDASDEVDEEGRGSEFVTDGEEAADEGGIDDADDDVADEGCKSVDADVLAGAEESSTEVELGVSLSFLFTGYVEKTSK